VPDLATSALPTVAVRLPAHPVARRLIELSTGAVAAPSANPFGYLSPTRAAHVADQLGDRVDFIVDGGRCPVGVESTVLDVTVDPPLVLRPGGLPLDRLEALLGAVEVFDRAATSPKAPGQLPSHYAPRARLRLVPAGTLPLRDPAPGAVALCFDASSEARLRADAPDRFARIVTLSPSGELVEAAAELFEILHALDAAGVAEIWAERVPDSGLGRAVNDRLYKASEK
jgi:L-threonylcarbamoyladenylate synthase